MGLTKEYLRYIPAGNFNIIASQYCNVKFVTLESQEGRFAAVGAAEHIIIWDFRLGEKAQVLPGEKAAVTALSASPNKRHLAAGYSDGNVQVYDLKSAEIINIFSGHKTEITTLVYDSFGHKLASGSKDTDIIIWDTVAETGLCRLLGHKGQITQLAFMTRLPILISASKDCLVKFWDLETNHCFKTLIGHRSEVWALTLVKEDQYLVTGSGDSELRVWKLSQRNLEEENKNPIEHLAASLELTNLDDVDDPNHPLQCHKVGSLLRTGNGRVVSMFSDSSGQIIGCHGTDMIVELFYFCSDDEAKIRLRKRIKREIKKQGQIETETSATLRQVCLIDEVKRLSVVKLKNKPKSLDLVLGSGGEVRIAIVLGNNSVYLYSIHTADKHAEPNCLRSITNHGHHSEVRAVAFSSDNLAIVSGDKDAIKMWNRPSQTCLRTIESGYVLSMVFVPGDRHIVAGMKDGRVLIVDVIAGDILEEIAGHTNEVWSVCLQPNQRGCVSGSSDKTVKFWQFELVADEKNENKAKILSLLHSRTLKLEEGVLCVRLSQNNKFIAVALLDSTVKIFFVDTFKFYLSLYGHKLPILSMDISSDSTLIATGSADRNVKIWGMDFGDCHKSIFAHDDSIISLQFIPKTHYFFTCGKDGKVKQWDGDTYNKIITLQGHIGESYGLAVSPNGQFVISCGADRVLRLYEKSDQLLILQDEEEEEREQQEALATGENTVVPGFSSLNLPSKKTVGSENAADSILECLEICEKYKEQLAEHEALQAASSQTLRLPPPHPLMQALNTITTDDFLLETIKRIRASDLEEALLLLPFNAVCDIIEVLPNILNQGHNIELVCKICMLLLKLHHKLLIANQSLLTTLQRLQKQAFLKVGELRDLVGYNFYAMQYIQREIELAEDVRLFYDMTLEKKKSEKKKKQKEKLKRSILVLNS